MPTDMRKYPANWKTEIRPRILERAGNCCERCGVRNGEWIVREPGTAYYLIYDPESGGYTEPDGTPIRMSELPDFWADAKDTRVVLTIAHIENPDPMDCRDENLQALCQKCHNTLDAPMRAKNAGKTRLKNKHAAIQQRQKPLWSE